MNQKIYKEFPIPIYTNIDFNEMTKDKVKFNISKHKTYCGLIPFPCLLLINRYETSISEINKYKFLTGNSSQRKKLLIREIKEINDFKRGRPGYHDGLVVKD